MHLKATCFVFLNLQTVFNTPQLGDIYGATFRDRPLNPKKIEAASNLNSLCDYTIKSVRLWVGVCFFSIDYN